ncbi:MerR family transcriptional regulator [Streptomyces sp. NBC_01565]|uniref:MerR family transcriptional regulator n=1 Tax=Streptomyces sp. NBC_01565 TaxID=2975881 RepID=UPI0022568561|nr:MerR family transcriptional regulator [Streptomyces sp. NBC_01565]MCX4539874.1 MerR family transcriptional regulator [Streptomyces sp. NBC_01565]
MLTIGQVATALGVTVRAIRHYHQRGLLPEPERDASGYRRYGADAIVALIRIRTLSDAGVPLARIEELMGASPEEFSAAVADIDSELRGRIRDLRRRRGRIAELAAGDALFLPQEVVVLLDRLRGLGLSPESVRTERDTWVLLAAQYPDQVPRWALQKRALFEDPAFQRLYLTADQAAGWDRDDPRLEALADEVNAFGGLRTPGTEDGAGPVGGAGPVLAVDALVTVTLMAAETGKPVPAWERLVELCRSRATPAARPS